MKTLARIATTTTATAPAAMLAYLLIPVGAGPRLHSGTATSGAGPAIRYAGMGAAARRDAGGGPGRATAGAAAAAATGGMKPSPSGFQLGNAASWWGIGR